MGKSGILARSEQLYRGSGVVRKEQALQIALDRLVDCPRRQLEVLQGWPPEMPRAQTDEEADAALENAIAVMYPERRGRPKPERPSTP
jgi:hypothetical protein